MSYSYFQVVRLVSELTTLINNKQRQINMKTKILITTLLLVLTTSVLANDKDKKQNPEEQDNTTTTEQPKEEPKDPGELEELARQIICTINPKDCV